MSRRHRISPPLAGGDQGEGESPPTRTDPAFPSPCSLPQGEGVSIAGAEAPRVGPARRVDLRFRRDPAGQTYLAEQRAGYPFHLCRLHRYAGDPDGMATLYLQSVSGGIYEGDDLAVSLTAEAQAQVHLTTQASTIVHSMRGSGAAHAVTLRAERDSFVEYMPDATILFPAARLGTRLLIEADESAAVIACDSFLMHDPRGSGATFGHLHASVEARRPDGRLLFADRYRMWGEAWAQGLPGVSGAQAAQGTLLVLHPCIAPERLVETLRAALTSRPDTYAGASALPNGCGAWARVLMNDGATLRAVLIEAWSAVRKLITDVRPQLRRK
jgi:urease accessory protein